MGEFVFEDVGWSRIDIGAEAQSAVERALMALGVQVDALDIAPLLTSFAAFRGLAEYEGEYRSYAGALEHCFLEKALEHYLSLIVVNPKAGMTGVDVGSCRSVLPALARRVYGVRYFEQDLVYAPGVNGDQIGSGADSIPLPGESVDFMTLHCTFEHFEGGADREFVKEAARLLRPGGTVVILPLYMAQAHCNVTGETDAARRSEIGWDVDASHYCVVPEWRNRFGRHYSPAAFVNRVYRPAVETGLQVQLRKVVGWEALHPDLWLRWVLILRR